MKEEKLKALANDILEQCQKQGLTFQETKMLLILMWQQGLEGNSENLENVIRKSLDSVGQDRREF